MKKIFIAVLFAFLFINSPVDAFSFHKKSKIVPVQKITFIYINGSNDFKGTDRTKFKDHFYSQVQEMHPYMMKAFNKDKLIYKNLLKNGETYINPEPVIFYWGDKSLEQVQHLDSDLSYTKTYSPKLSQLVRSTFAHCLHDAVWVQKSQNMSVIIDELQAVVNSETDKGNEVILLGYSAGSFITYQYFLNKFISLEPAKLDFKKDSPEIQTIINANDAKKTCLDALLEANLVKLDVNGKYTGTKDIEVFRKNYPRLDEYTNIACIKEDSVKGVINFASPLALFYSQVTDSKSDLNFLSKLMYKHILETDTFWLTVNYREDPLGFPTSKNLSREELEELAGGKIHSNGGFVYDKSDVKSGKSFISAHMAYWDTQRLFVKGIVKAYNSGYKNLYQSVIDFSDNEAL